MRIGSWMILCALLMVLLPIMAVSKNNVEIGGLRRTVRGFSAIDTNYIEPQHYNWSMMLQGTYTYEIYRLRSDNGQDFTFAPDVGAKIGPFFGWRWLFLGYTFDLKNIQLEHGKQELNLSFYSSQIGVDLFYRRTGSDYKMRKVSMGDGALDDRLNGVSFGGISVGITGVNLYYIFNHNRFSYPAAFSQSTCQKISCGSWIAGVSYTKQSLDLDYDQLKQVVESHSDANTKVALDTSLNFSSLKYLDVGISGGYAYNWVFAKNFLACFSGSVTLGYKHTEGNVHNDLSNDRGFNINNFNVDGFGRFGVVYNNTKWYAGSNIITHAYNYKQSRLSTNNIFGCLNVYVGFNFGLRQRYKNKK